MRNSYAVAALAAALAAAPAPAAARDGGAERAADVAAGTEWPLFIGVEGRYRPGDRWYVSATLGATPHGYIRSIDGIARSLNLYNDDVGLRVFKPLWSRTTVAAPGLSNLSGRGDRLLGRVESELDGFLDDIYRRYTIVPGIGATFGYRFGGGRS